ncbi:hypothetical protein AUP45_03865 [Thalassospira xiamenensis]|nr:hypothetical protein AUP45_03865 [Thalassospira xiamenensis]
MPIRSRIFPLVAIGATGNAVLIRTSSACLGAGHFPPDAQNEAPFGCVVCHVPNPVFVKTAFFCDWRAQVSGLC